MCTGPKREADVSPTERAHSLAFWARFKNVTCKKRQEIFADKDIINEVCFSPFELLQLIFTSASISRRNILFPNQEFLICVFIAARQSVLRSTNLNYSPTLYLRKTKTLFDENSKASLSLNSQPACFSIQQFCTLLATIKSSRKWMREKNSSASCLCVNNKINYMDNFRAISYKK